MDRFKPLFKRLNNKFLFGAVIAFMGSFLLFPPFFDSGLYPIQPSEFSWYSLDPSWIIALNYAKIQDFTWGKDIAFTYGPLAYLSTKVGWGINKWDFIIYDLFISFNFFYIFYKNYVYSQNKKLTTILIVAICFIIPQYIGSGAPIILLAFLVFWIRESLENDNYINYIFQIILLVLMFFIKLNTGIISFALVFPFLIYQWIFNKQLRKLYILYVLVLFSLIILFGYILNVSLFNYIVSGLNIVSGYNEIMFLDLKLENELVFAIIFIIFSLAVLLKNVYRDKVINYKGLMVLFLFALPIYVLYKQAFVRADIMHIIEFFTYSLLFIFCVRDFHAEKFRYNSDIVLVLIFISFFITKRQQDSIFNFKEKLDKSNYFTGASVFTETSGIHLFPNDNQLSKTILNKVSGKKVDIFPWNISLLFENKLNYLPRPVIQSYSAYTPYLEELNFEHYNSPKAPDFVFYEFETIDNRYPLFDEAKVNIALLNNYRCVDTFSLHKKPIILLQKKDTFKPISFEKIKEYETDINIPIVPEEDKFYEIEVSNSLLGKIGSIVKHSPELFIMINTKDGKGNGFKTSKSLLKSGLFSKYFITNTLDYKNYADTRILNENQEIVSYLVWPKSPENFGKKIKITEYKIK